MTVGWWSEAVPLPLTTGESDDRDPDVLVSAVCYHISDGWDSRNHLQNVKNDASVHFLVREELVNGIPKAVTYQFLSIFRTAFGNGRHSGTGNPYMPEWIKSLIRRGKNPNYATISIEHEGKYPQALPFSDLIIEESIRLVKWICSQLVTVIKDRAHQIGHYQIQHIDRAFCPGGPGGRLFPFDRIVTALNTIASNPLWVNPSTHPIIVPEFKKKYLDEPHAFEYWGLPIKDTEQALLSDGESHTIQWFERARFELHPKLPEGKRVLLGLVGVEAST